MGFMKKYYISLFLSFFIFNSTFSMFMPLLDLNGNTCEVLQKNESIDDVNIDNLYDIDSTVERILDFLHFFNDSYLEWLQNKQFWSKYYPEKFLNKKENTFVDDKYNFPNIFEWVLDPKEKVNVVGDIHGNFQTIKSILDNLIGMDRMDKKLQLKDNNKLVFLGDYTDRGKENLKVLCSVIILALKNPGRVVLLRGNHENIDMNEHYFKNRETIKDNILYEFVYLALDKHKQDDIKNFREQLKLFYNYLPDALLLGYKNFNQLKLLVHGGFELRIDYEEMLNDLVEKNLKKGGLFALFIDESLIMDQDEIEDFIRKFLENECIENNKEQIIDSWLCNIKKFLNPVFDFEIGYGFFWNTFSSKYASGIGLSESDRGQGILDFDLEFSKYFFNRFCIKSEIQNITKAKISGLIRGHDHQIPKINKLFQERLDEDVDNLETPSCCIFNEKDEFLLKKDSDYYDQGFSITTLISGNILNGDKVLSYPPTFLSLEFDNQNWKYQTFYY
ncbi:hypothetical protein GF322_02140 [Candidatus Dependentiae bacterium]|nr:hypothetical protein [Candidatus Dependentiae bacterium]